MRRRQNGASLLFVVIVLASVALAFFAMMVLFRSTSATSGSSQTASRFAAVSTALEQFASTAGRLPCPANPTLAPTAASEGEAVPPGASAECTNPTGTIPWKTIGVRREDALDASGWKISYRVYTGNSGSLTQADGVSMVNCDTEEPFPAGRTLLTVNSGGLCRTTRNTMPDEYFGGKGFQVNDFGTIRAPSAAGDGIAYVLISHGPTGHGAYTVAGVQKLPVPANANEMANLGATGPFVAAAAVPADVAAPGSLGHFDDVISYRSIADVVRRSNLSARPWDEELSSVRLDNPTVSSALGQSTTSYGDVGQQSLNFAGSRVTAFNSGGNQNITFDVIGSTEGIGGAGGANTLSSSGGEGLRIELAVRARQFAMTLSGFGGGTFIIIPYQERVEIRFKDGAVTVATTTKQGCRPDGGLASLSHDAGVEFDSVEIRPLPATLPFINSAFLLSEFKTCAAGPACQTSLSDPGNICP